MKKSILITLIFGMIYGLHAQVPKKIVLEHFTNTRCGICASKNPGLFSNLENNKAVIHMAVHPSSPYSNCVLYQHNPTENNARTNYYGVLGGTPRIVINGEVQSPSVNFSSATLFDDFKSESSPVSLALTQTKHGEDSVQTRVVIKTLTTHTFDDVEFYLALVEDSLHYSAPNGEKLHHNVFRKVMFSGSITLPSVGDSLVLNATVEGNQSWDFKQLHSIGIVQNMDDKKTIQAETTEPNSTNTTSLNDLKISPLKIYPVPVQEVMYLESPENLGFIEVFSVDGQKLLEFKHDQSLVEFDMSSLESGVYFLRYTNGEAWLVQRFIKE